MKKDYKDRLARSMAGLMLVVLIAIQKVLQIDLSLFLFAIAANLMLFGLTGYCPIASFFLKKGWMKV